MFRFRQSLAYRARAAGGTTLAQGAFKLKATAGTDRHVFCTSNGEDIIVNFDFRGSAQPALCINACSARRSGPGLDAE
jgi:hypothetical protein